VLSTTVNRSALIWAGSASAHSGRSTVPSGRSHRTSTRARPSVLDRISSGVPIANLDVAAVARPEAFEDFYRAGLAGAVWSEQAEHLARKDLEIDPFDGLKGSVVLGQAADVNRCGGHIGQGLQ
jgi:hypothetical protein